MVSVCMITYNHEKYIGQAIEGVLLQKCNFPIELVIGEDCSTDSTRKICEEYQRNNNIIKLLPSENNLGVIPNFIRTLSSCKGKYIAFCEGDDYWIDPLKLQKQADYLEKNPRVSMLTSHYVIYDQERDVFITPPKIKYELNFDTLIKKRNKIATATVCFRNEFAIQYIDEIKPLEKGWLAGDFSLWLFLSQKGQVKILKDITTVYRKLLNSASHNSSVDQQFNFFRSINSMIDFYVKKYGCKDDTRIQFEKYKHNLEINFAFNLKNKTRMKEEMIKKREAGFKVGLKYYIKYLFILLNIYSFFNSINYYRKRFGLDLKRL